MEPLLVADSFRVRVNDGRAEARGLDRHLERFTRATIQAARVHGAPTHDSGLEAFLKNARHKIADFGEGFPRLELRSDGELGLQLRSLPELRESIELRSLPPLSSERRLPWHSDNQANQPERKGPNIERFAAFNRELGAEALLQTPEGHVLEGTTTSVLWWQGDVLYTVRDQQRVASVTEALLAAVARTRGVTVRTDSILSEELTRHEAWAVNALHGVRRITRIDEVELPQADEARLNSYREALDHTWVPVLGQ